MLPSNNKNSQPPPAPAPAPAPAAGPAPEGILQNTGELLVDTKNKVTEAAANAGNYLSNAGSQAVGTIGSKIQNVPTLFSEVSSSSMYDNMTSWFSSESIFSKFVFVVLAMVVFFFMLRISLMLALYLIPSISSPYLVSGVLEGGKSVEIQQDPRVEDSKIVTRSKNQKSGVEFTWCMWLMIGQNSLDSTDLNRQYVIFSKGNPQTQNGPKVSVGLQKMNAGSQQDAPDLAGSVGGISAYLVVDMDTYTTTQTANISTIKVTNIPMKKWVHICVRLQNTALDIYVNGNATRRVILPEVPVQNYGNVYVFPENANKPRTDKFGGFISDLIYYPHALNVYRLQALVEAGPNKSPSVFATTAEMPTTGNYLSSLWYSTQRA